MSDAEKSDHELIVDDTSEGSPNVLVVNGSISPRLENGLIDRTSSSMLVPSNGSAPRKDATPHSPRSGTTSGSNASTPSTKRMDGEKPTTPISARLLAPSVPINGAKSPASGKALQNSSLANSVPSTVAYPTLRYPSAPPLPHASNGADPRIDALGHNGYPTTPKPPVLQQMYDPHAATRTFVGSAGIAQGKP